MVNVTHLLGHFFIFKKFGDEMDLNVFGKKEEIKKEESSGKEESSEPVGKYNEQCALCGKAPTDKHWGGQYFHKKCFRQVKKGARGML